MKFCDTGGRQPDEPGGADRSDLHGSVVVIYSPSLLIAMVHRPPESCQVVPIVKVYNCPSSRHGQGVIGAQGAFIPSLGSATEVDILLKALPPT